MLSEEVFSRGFKLLCGRFGRRRQDDMAAVYYDRVIRIPDKPWMDIVYMAIDHERQFPSPGWLLNQWAAWQQTHPGNMDYSHRTPCVDCDGEGVILAQKKAENMCGAIPRPGGVVIRTSGVYEYCFRCAACKNWQHRLGTDIPIATRDEIANAGYLIVDRYDPDIPGTGITDKAAALRQIVKKTADRKEIPF